MSPPTGSLSRHPRPGANVTDDIVCPELYEIFKPFKAGEPMQPGAGEGKRGGR